MGPEDEGQGTETGIETNDSVAPETGGGNGLNPAWNDLMSIVPSQLHSQVTPHLAQWDKNYQESLNKVHSQYEPYKPFLENQIAPENINYALQLVQAIEQRPQEVIAALQQYVGGGEQQQQQQPQTGEQGQVDEIPSEFLNHPEFKKYTEMVNTMAQLWVQQNQQAQTAREDQELVAELSKLKEEHGEYDEQWVLSHALANPNVPLAEHVKAYKAFEDNILASARKPGPPILPSGGVAPNNQVDLKSLDDKGRRGLVAQMLQAAQENSR